MGVKSITKQGIKRKKIEKKKLFIVFVSIVTIVQCKIKGNGGIRMDYTWTISFFFLPMNGIVLSKL